MTHDEFRAALKKAGLKQVEFANLISILAGEEQKPNVVTRWATGRRPVSRPAAALITLINLLDEDTMNRAWDYMYGRNK